MTSYTNEEVKELREKRRISQAELAKLTGLSPSLISSYELGTRKVSDRSAERLERAFKQVLPVAPAEKVETAELADYKTRITVHGVILTEKEINLLVSLATALINQR